MRSGSWRAAAGILPHPWQLAKEVGADISWILTVFLLMHVVDEKYG